MFHFVQLVDKNQEFVKTREKIEMETVKLKTKAFHNTTNIQRYTKVCNVRFRTVQFKRIFDTSLTESSILFETKETFFDSLNYR